MQSSKKAHNPLLSLGNLMLPMHLEACKRKMKAEIAPSRAVHK